MSAIPSGTFKKNTSLPVSPGRTVSGRTSNPSTPQPQSPSGAGLTLRIETVSGLTPVF
jgi:hypothetical protein